MLSAGFSQAQIIELEEARLSFSPVSLGEDNVYSVNVLENYVGEFEKDPLVFMQNNFDIKEFIAQVQREDFEYYLVSFRTKKGNFAQNLTKLATFLPPARNLKIFYCRMIFAISYTAIIKDGPW